MDMLGSQLLLIWDPAWRTSLHKVDRSNHLHQKKKASSAISSIFVPALAIFEGQIHSTHDDLVIRFRDDGSSTLPSLGWEGHDEGDKSANADTQDHC